MDICSCYELVCLANTRDFTVLPRSLPHIPYTPDLSTKHPLPLFLNPVSAGFPSPAEDFVENKLDLNQHLIEHPTATFFVRVSGSSMLKAGIHPGDLLVVDRSLEPKDRNVVIAVVNGELVVKRFHRKEEEMFLLAENEDYAPIAITEAMDFSIWGVVTTVIHPL
jgi:DNA polymerase V